MLSAQICDAGGQSEVVPFTPPSHLEGVPPPQGAGEMLPSARWQGSLYPHLVPAEMQRKQRGAFEGLS